MSILDGLRGKESSENREFERSYLKSLESLEKNAVEDPVNVFHNNLNKFLNRYLNDKFEISHRVDNRNFTLFFPPIFEKTDSMDLIDFYILSGMVLMKNAGVSKGTLKSHCKSSYSRNLIEKMSMMEGKAEKKVLKAKPSYNEAGDTIVVRSMPETVRKGLRENFLDPLTNSMVLNPLLYVNPNKISPEEFWSYQLHETTHMFHRHLLAKKGVDRPINKCKKKTQIVDEAAASAVSKVYYPDFEFHPEGYTSSKEHGQILRDVYEDFIEKGEERSTIDASINRIREVSGKKILSLEKD